MSRVQDLRDEMLAHDIYDTLVNHKLLYAWIPSITVRGSVAHICGRVPSEEIRKLLRQTINRVRGIDAVWDSLYLTDERDLRIIDIGCGNHKQLPRALGVDRHPHTAVDIVADIENGLPFADDTVDHIYAVHILEHVHELLRLMNDIHRVLKPGGILHVMVPQWQYVNAVADPTHVRFFHTQTFKYFCQPYPNIRQFMPLSIAASTADLLAELTPIKQQPPNNFEKFLARFFD